MNIARMIRMFDMAVWDNEGRMYLPVWGYDDRISHYARANEALTIAWNQGRPIQPTGERS